MTNRRRRASWPPDETERAELASLVAHTQTVRVGHQWPEHDWTVERNHCAEALSGIRELGIEQCRDLVTAAAWVDSRRTGAEPVARACRAGEHLNLPRIFQPSTVERAIRWRDRWQDAGRPEPARSTPTPTAPWLGSENVSFVELLEAVPLPQELTGSIDPNVPIKQDAS